MLQKFILNLLIEAAKNPEVQQFVDDRIRKLKADLLPDIIASFPAFIGGGAEAFAKLLNLPNLPNPGQLAQDTAKNILDSDPDLPVLSNIIDLSEMAKRWLSF